MQYSMNHQYHAHCLRVIEIREGMTLFLAKLCNQLRVEGVLELVWTDIHGIEYLINVDESRYIKSQEVSLLDCSCNISSLNSTGRPEKSISQEDIPLDALNGLIQIAVAIL